MIAIKRRFAYYANPHHDQGFWDGDWWWTVVPSSRSCKFDYKSRPKFKTAKKTRSIRAHSDSEDVWAGASTPSPSGDDAEGDGRKFDYKSRPKFRRAKKTKSIRADRDSEDVWADVSTPSPSGDDAEGHDRKSTVMAVAATLNDAMPEQLEGQRQSIDRDELAAAGWRARNRLLKLGGYWSRHQLPSPNTTLLCPLTVCYQKANR
ncbi:hypothetical protein JB92DRAFT_3150434 [Gautieria morchelliformis]|nr:hypothetical protein JB92DRAFT_3150434 [Gautieria morchelliformis]